MLLNRQLTNQGHVHRLVIAQDLEGWEVREEEDSAVLRRAHREDWHRVEMDTWLFGVKALELKRQGWVEN
jgi:hypothetical protein